MTLGQLLKDNAIRTGIKLVQLREKIETLRKRCAALRCRYEDVERPAYEEHKKYDYKYWPCWRTQNESSEEAGPYAFVTAAELRDQDAWCEACLAREPVRAELRAARAKHGGIARAHWDAIRLAACVTL